MDFPIYIDKISMDLSILYLTGHSLKNIYFNIFLSLKNVFILVNSADPDEMPPYFIWVFTVCQSTCL